MNNRPNNQLAPQNNAPATFSNFITGEGIKRKINEMVGGKDGQRFITSIISAVSNNPALAECEHGSILSAAMLGESLGLSPSVQLGQFYMVPFKDRKNNRKVATFQIGYKGYIQLAIRSGQYKKLNVLAIKEGELIHYDPLFEELEVELIQDDTIREETPTIGYYAMFEYLNGFRKTMYWSKAKMETHADKYSFAFSLTDYRRLLAGEIPQRDMWKFSSFWYKDFDAMAFKTMLRQIISKWGIMSIEIQQAMGNDHALVSDTGPQLIDTAPIPPETTTGQEQPTKTTEKRESPEDDFFSGSAEKAPDQKTTASNGDPDEIELANEAMGDGAEAYAKLNAAERKDKLSKNLKAFGANLSDMERKVGKTYGQWTKKDRIVLLGALKKLALGAGPETVFPTN